MPVPPRKPTRELNWVSSLDPSNLPALQTLQDALQHYYATSGTYYSDIDFTAHTWADGNLLETQDMLNEVLRHENVLEVGCGKANILKSGKIDPRHYTGIDFSSEVIQKNREAHPGANFQRIENISRFPVDTGKYDFVFSHFVLEHCVFPNLFLDECARALCPGGILSVLCPDFLGRNHMSSQRVGFSPGTGREKLSKGRVLDAIVTGYDNKIRIRLEAFLLRAHAQKHPRFYINLAPTCFTDQFRPDVDAVYLTFADEIRSYLANLVQWLPLEDSLRKYSAACSHIYLKGRRKNDR